MKKWKIILPNLLATVSMPLITLVGCNETKNVYVVTLFAGSGTFGQTKQIILSNIKPGTILKDVPGYAEPVGDRFVGWVNQHEFFDSSAPVTSNLFLQANYESPRNLHTITLFANGGTFVSQETNILNYQVIGEESTLGEITENVTPQGPGEFKKWIDKDGNEVKSTDKVTSSLILKAVYEDYTPQPMHVVTLFANGGMFTQQNEFINLEVNNDDTSLDKLPGYEEPISGKAFDKWIDENGNVIDKTMKITSDLLIKATYDLPEDIYKIAVINPVEDGFSVDKTQAISNKDLVLNVSSLTPMNNTTLDHIIIGGTPISDFTFTPEEGNEKHGVISIPGSEITGDIYIYFVKSSIPVPYDFCTDAWQTVAYYADRGLETLCEAYQCRPDDFVGLERNIVMYGHVHKVRVIGINQDEYQNGDHVSKAALTFQFSNLISRKSDGKFLATLWSHTPHVDDNKNYWNSTIEKNLNSKEYNASWATDSGEKRSIYKMMEEMDPYQLWFNSIKNVFRSICVIKGEYNGNASWVNEEKAVKFFLPTVSNIFSANSINGSVSRLGSPQARKLLANEGQRSGTIKRQYEYYALEGNINETSFDSYEHEKCLALQALTPDINSDYYWVASPENQTYEEGWMIFPNGAWTTRGVSNIFGIAPCFCL